MGLQDALITLPHARYGEYLTRVYTRMAAHIAVAGSVIEIGARNDRGVISRRIIPHTSFLCVDRNPRRPGLTIDVLNELVSADTIISTCVLHHTKREDVSRLLFNLEAPLLMLSGPNVEVWPDLIGDHEWHIEPNWLRDQLAALGYETIVEPIGMSEPFCEVLVVAKR